MDMKLARICERKEEKLEERMWGLCDQNILYAVSKNKIKYYFKISGNIGQ